MIRIPTKLDKLGFKSIRSLAKAIKVDEHELRSVAELCKSSYLYDAWKEPKRHGHGFRLIEHPKKKLKIIQFRLNRLFQRLDLPRVFHGCYTDTHIKSNALPHFGNRHYESFDLANYYFNLGYRKVFLAFMGQDCSADAASLLTRLTTTHGHVPQGAPTSPMVAVLALLSAQARLRKLCESIDAVITVYGDNICISGPPHISRYTSTFQRILFQESFVVNLLPDKRVSRTEHEPWPLPGVELRCKTVDVREDDHAYITKVLKKCKEVGPEGLATMVCVRFKQKLQGQVYHYRWVGTNDGVCSLRAIDIESQFQCVQWPELYAVLPCQGNKCDCDVSAGQKK